MSTEKPGSREHYYFIDWLRAVACFFVVFHHVLGYFRDSALGSFYVHNVKTYLPTVAVYLLLSGFVQCQLIEMKSGPYSRYVLDKFKRIMVPYLLISVITVFIRLLVERSHLIPLTDFQYTPFVLSNVLSRIFFSGVEGQYYFLEIIFIYLLLFPFFVKLINTKLKTLVFFAAVLAIDYLVMPYYMRLHTLQWTPWNILVSMCAGFKFFFFGFLLNRFYGVIKGFLEKYGALVGGAAVLIFVLFHAQVLGENEYLDLVLIFGYFSLAKYFVQRPYFWVTQVSSLSFGIFLLHQPYFLKISRLLLGPMIEDTSIKLVTESILTFILVAVFVSILQKSKWASRLVLGREKSIEIKL